MYNQIMWQYACICESLHYFYTTGISMLLYSVAIALIAGVAADNVHYVLPNDKVCVRLPCRDLQYFIDNSHQYFISNSKFFFVEGTYHHLRTDLIIQNIANISLIGLAVSNTSSPTSIIQCFPEHTIKFHSVRNITITNILFMSCGNEEAIPIQRSDTIIQPSEFQPKYWASIFFTECINIMVSNVHIESSIGYGITLANVMGRNILSNITIVITRDKLYRSLLYTCSNGISVIYSGRKYIHVTPSIIIFHVTLIQTKTFIGTNCVGDKMISVLLKQEKFDVHLMISHSIFYQLYGNIISIAIESSANNSVHFSNCEFTNNYCTKISLTHLIGIFYELMCYSSVSIAVTNCNFTRTRFYGKYISSAIFNFEVAVNHKCSLPQYDSVIVNFSNVYFYFNEITLLQVLPTLPAFLKELTIVTINAANNFIVKSSNSRSSLKKLILLQLHYTKFCFRGKSVFGSSFYSDIIHSHSSKLIFSNHTLFYGNYYCDQLIRLDGNWQYIILKDNATIEFINNTLNNELVSVPITYNHPFRYCFFQFISDAQNYFFNTNFNINFSNNKEQGVNTKRGNSTLNQLTSHCKWIDESLFQNSDGSILYNKITHKDKLKLGIHTAVCYCQWTSHYNCNVNELGPIYPGQTLTANFCLPYNYENIGLLYAETHNNNLPLTACKVIDQDNLKHAFTSNYSRSVDFTIASNSPTKCELFLTAQPDLFTSYDVFDIQLLPCPLGFSFKHGICDCDPLLSLYTEKCVIYDQTIRKLSNHWITGNTPNNDTKYLVGDSCPIVYCSHNMMVNVHWPDSQCQQHRTGPLCSHCTTGYSVVLGSSRCKKCTNMYLISILLFLLTGVLLVVFLFVSNLTVTIGTIDGMILFLNIVEMNGHLFELQNRLVNPLLSYVMRFKMINRFKPIIDAFQGPFKHHCYYWIGLHLFIRNIMFLLSALLKDLSIAIGGIIIITISIVHGYIQPYKSSMINFQESLLLYNYSILCVLLLLNDDEFYSVIVLNVMVGLSMVHFLIIIAYHVFTYVIHAWLPNMCRWYNLHRGTSSVNINNIEMEQFENFQEPLLGQD